MAKKVLGKSTKQLGQEIAEAYRAAMGIRLKPLNGLQKMKARLKKNKNGKKSKNG
jgi:hypothetical protein